MEGLEINLVKEWFQFRSVKQTVNMSLCLILDRGEATVSWGPSKHQLRAQPWSVNRPTGDASSVDKLVGRDLEWNLFFGLSCSLNFLWPSGNRTDEWKRGCWWSHTACGTWHLGGSRYKNKYIIIKKTKKGSAILVEWRKVNLQTITWELRFRCG